jgi:hypothetical protein
MVKVKLNEKYINEFLTTHVGHVFYRKHNKLNKEENIIDVDLSNVEITSLLQQGILLIVPEEKKEVFKKPVPTIKEDTPKNNINTKLEIDN